MPDLNIPGYAVVLLGALGTTLIGWLVWLTLKTNENEKNLAINTTNDNALKENVAKDLKNIETKIDDLKAFTKDQINDLKNQINAFMGNEVAFLKDVVRDKTGKG